jgi:hypothetical protein
MLYVKIENERLNLSLACLRAIPPLDFIDFSVQRFVRFFIYSTIMLMISYFSLSFSFSLSLSLSLSLSRSFSLSFSAVAM